MRPSPGPRRAKQGNEHTCGTPRRGTHARLIGRQTRPPPGRAVSRNVADRRVTRAKKAPRAHWVLGSGDPSTQSVKPLNTRPQSRRRPERHRGKPRGSAPAEPLGLKSRAPPPMAGMQGFVHTMRLFSPTATPAPPERAGTTRGGRHVTAPEPQSKELILGCPPWRHKRPGPPRKSAALKNCNRAWSKAIRDASIDIPGPGDPLFFLMANRDRYLPTCNQ